MVPVRLKSFMPFLRECQNFGFSNFLERWCGTKWCFVGREVIVWCIPHWEVFHFPKELSTCNIHSFDPSSCSRHLVSLALVGFLWGQDAWLSFCPWVVPAPPVSRSREESGPGRSSVRSQHYLQPPRSNRLASCQRHTALFLLPSLTVWRGSLWFCLTLGSVWGWFCLLVCSDEAFCSITLQTGWIWMCDECAPRKVHKVCLFLNSSLRRMYVCIMHWRHNPQLSCDATMLIYSEALRAPLAPLAQTGSKPGWADLVTCDCVPCDLPTKTSTAPMVKWRLQDESWCEQQWFFYLFMKLFHKIITFVSTTATFHLFMMRLWSLPPTHQPYLQALKNYCVAAAALLHMYCA